MSGIGIPQEQIALIIGVGKPALHKYYREELDLGLAEANVKVASSLFNQAIGGNITAAIFWAKVRLGWREVNITEVTHRYVARMPAATEDVTQWEQQNSPKARQTTIQ